jgi:hypothetical protein
MSKTKRITVQKPNVEKFDLMKVENKQLIHVGEWEQKLQKLVDENPFVAITDKESYNLAKSRKAILKNARLELRTTGKKESQESILMTRLNGIKDFVKDTINNLVAIPSIPEDLQELEINRYDLILQAEKDESDRLEGLRVYAIKNEIERVKNVLSSAIENSKFETLVDDELAFKLLKSTNFDFAEFDFLFDEMIDEKTKEFELAVINIKKLESQRIDELEAKIEAKLNQIIIDGQQLVDEIDGTINEKLLKQMVSGIFQTMIDCDVEFDQGSIEKMESEKQKVLIKVSEKLTQLEKQESDSQRERILEVREGLLDIIFDLTPEKIDETVVYINESLDQSVLPELQPEFDKMKLRVETALKQKLDSLADEIEKSKQDAIELEKKEKAELDQRVKRIESIGLFFDDLRNELTGFDRVVTLEQLNSLDDLEMDELVVYLSQAKKDDQDEKNRQELLKEDKAMMKKLVASIAKLPSIDTFGNKESKDFWITLQNEVDAFVEGLQKEINNL